MRIVIVDDEKWIRLGIISKLCSVTGEADTILEAESGEEALDLLKSTAADIMITDIKMSGMDGLDLIKKCKALVPHMRFIIISGYTEFDYAKEAVNMGVASYLLKPILEEDIVDAYSKVVSDIIKDITLSTNLITISRNVERLTIEKELNKLINAEIDDIEESLEVDCLKSLENAYIMMLSIEISTKKSDYSRELMNELEKIHLSGSKVLNFHNEGNLFQIISLHYSDDKNRLGVNTLTYANEIFSCFKGENMFKLNIGISSCKTGLVSIKQLFEESQHALLDKFMKGKNGIFIYHETNERISGNIIMKEIESELKTINIYLKERNLSAIEKAIRTIFDVLVTKIKEGIFLINILSEFEKIFSSFIYSNGINLDTDNLSYITRSEYLSYTQITEDIISDLTKLASRIIKCGINGDMNTLEIIEDLSEYLVLNYNQKIKLQDISKKYFINQSYISEMFKKLKGCSFTDYLISIRMDNAKKALTKTDLKINKIAKMVGYDEPLYFSRIFTKVVGLSPQKYRDIHNENK